MLGCWKVMKWFILCWILNCIYCSKIALHPVMGLMWIACNENVTGRVWHNSNALNMLQTGSGITAMYLICYRQRLA